MSDIFDTFWADERTRETFRREISTDGSVPEREMFQLWVKAKLWGLDHPEVQATLQRYKTSGARPNLPSLSINLDSQASPVRRMRP